jgi:hypothetical protein
MFEIPITTLCKTVASAAYGQCHRVQLGPVLKYGVVVATAVVHVAVNSRQWVVDRAAMLEKPLELRLANNTDCVLLARAAVVKPAKALQDLPVLLSTTLQVPFQLAYVPAVDTAATAHVSIQ